MALASRALGNYAMSILKVEDQTTLAKFLLQADSMIVMVEQAVKHEDDEIE